NGGGGEGGGRTAGGNKPQDGNEDDGEGELPADDDPGFDSDLLPPEDDYENENEQDQEFLDEEDVSSPDLSSTSDSSSSEQPPWSTDYNFSDPGRRDNRPPPHIRSKGYDADARVLGPEFNGLEKESDMTDDAFLRSHSGYEDGWKGIKILGTGGEGRAGLFQKDNADGTTSSICIKQKNNFRNDPKLRKPTEVTVLEDLRDRPKNGSIVLLKYRRYPKIMAHRLYMEFCEHSDLYYLISRYRRRKQYLPEEFIWDVFHHLVNAIKAMDSGPSKRKHPYLTTYVHRDIKPENIFLAAPQGYNDGGIPAYPTTKLGDFGFAIATGEDDEHNPHRLKDLGSKGYKAPEQKLGLEELDARKYTSKQRKKIDDFVPKGVTKDWPQLGTHTNIWGVGACMYELILLTTASLDLTKAANEGGALGKLQTHRTPEYSKPLTNLVHQCLKHDPKRRPKLNKLEEVIDLNRSQFRDQWSAGKPVPEEAVIRLTRAEIDKMEYGPFIQKEHDKNGYHYSTDNMDWDPSSSDSLDADDLYD
ncbi:MAG: hypothetical protein Q9226_007459, partial [Calogaya cf. arnoldii]